MCSTGPRLVATFPRPLDSSTTSRPIAHTQADELDGATDNRAGSEHEQASWVCHACCAMLRWAVPHPKRAYTGASWRAPRRRGD